MSTGHFVSHIGTRIAPKRCANKCGRDAQGVRNGRWLCDEHLRHGWQDVTSDHVRIARQMMINGGGLTEIAISLDVSRQELDAALWRHIAEPLGRQPRGMF